MANYEHRNREQFDAEAHRLLLGGIVEPEYRTLLHALSYIDFLEAKEELKQRELDRLQDELKTANAKVSALLKHEVPWARTPANEQVLP